MSLWCILQAMQLNDGSLYLGTAVEPLSRILDCRVHAMHAECMHAECMPMIGISSCQSGEKHCMHGLTLVTLRQGC